MSIPATMKFMVLTLLTLASTAYTKNLQYDDFVKANTAFGYHRKFGISLAKGVLKSEKAVLLTPSVTIARGSVAKQGQFPYQAGLINKLPASISICGGSLISTSRVMTAAHCWFDGEQQATRVEVVLGSAKLFSGGTRKFTRNVVMHPKWDPRAIRNDIAIIYLPSEVSLSAHIATIALPSGNDINEDFVGDTAVASGFGITSGGSRISNSQVLSHVNLKVISNTECRRSYWVIQPSQICTSGAKGSTCPGDSGGPLVISTNDGPTVIGITSFGSSLGCQTGAPAAFTRVSSFISFIQRNL